MSDAADEGRNNAATVAFAAVSLGLLTIVTVWKIKKFKYGLINETGGAVVYGE